MRRCDGWIAVMALVSLLLGIHEAAAQQVAGSTTAGSDGTGTIQFDVDPTLDPELVALQLSQNVALNGGAQLQSVTVENGLATIAFMDAAPGAIVEATVPVDVATSIGLVGEGAGTLAGGVHPLAFLGGGLLVVAGGVAAGLEATDNLGEDDREFVLSPIQ